MNSIDNGRENGEKLFHGGRIWLDRRGDPGFERADWIHIRGQQVLAAGEGAPPHVSEASRIDLEGDHLLPAFADAHSHLTVGAFIPGGDGTGLHDTDAALRAVAEQAQRTVGHWVWLLGAPLTHWSRLPNAQELEAAAGGRPVLIADISLHHGLLSESGLEACGFSAMHPDPSGDLERRRGKLTGSVWESAFGTALNHALMDHVHSLDPHTLEERLLAECERHLALGITRVHDPCVSPALMEVLQRVSRRTRLRLSWSITHEDALVGGRPVYDQPDFGGAGSQPVPASTKLFLDGAERCALCLSPVHAARMATHALKALIRGRLAPLLALAERPMQLRQGHFHTDALRETDAAVARLLATANEADLRPRIHALGNAAVTQACNAIRSLGESKRGTLEHIVLAGPGEIEAVAGSGYVASVQPGFLQYYGPFLSEAGIDRVLGVVPVRSLLASGTAVAISSDYPCGPLDPLHNVRAAVHRQTCEGAVLQSTEAISAEAAVRAATTGGRHAIDGVHHCGLRVGGVFEAVRLSGSPDHPDTCIKETFC